MDPFVILVAGLAFVTVAGVGLALSGVGANAGKISKRAQIIGQRGRIQAQSGRSSTLDASQRRKQLQRTLQEHEKKRRAAALDVGLKLRHAGLTMRVQTYWLMSGGF